MDDILSQGEDREPSPWPRRLAVIGAIVLVAVAGVVYLTLPRHQHPSAAARPAPAPVNPVPVNPVPVNPVSVNLAAPGLPGEPDGILGHTLPWDASLRIPVAGPRPALFSPATGRSEPIGGLPADSSGYQFTRIGGGWAVQAAAVAKTACGDCAGPPLPVWFLADGARSVTRVGTANQVAPAATPGALWLTSYPLTANTITEAGTAREVSLAGLPLGAPVRLPSGYMIDQATDRGLLLAPVSPRQGTADYKLWNPAAPRASRVFAGVIAASATEIAWTPNCSSQCQVQMLDLATGRHTVVGLPRASSAASGAFSPSGGFLALQVSSGSTGDDGALAMQLEVASVTSGRLTVMPGTSVSSDALVGFGWPGNGDSLVAEFIFTTRTQLVAWDPGAARPAVAVIQPGQNQASLIIG
jgi:hypothetical protein